MGEALELGPYLLGYNDVNQGIYTGDAKVLCEEIPDESIDVIMTDPPYKKEYLPLYGWLSEMASEKLKQGGWLFAYGAGEHLPDHLYRMSQYLDYFWVFVLRHLGGYPRMWHKKLLSGYKPIMVYTKGFPTTNPWKATIHSDAMDKRYHKWGQGVGFSLKMIDILKPAITFDPMTGGGTTPAACKTLSRNYLAFEIEPQTATTARKRLIETPIPIPLPNITITQLDLNL